MRRLRVCACLVAAAAGAFAASPALAHHPLGGETPATWGAGLLSGIGHPVIGLDHLAFVLAAGIFAGITAAARGGVSRKAALLSPGIFIAATCAGAGLHSGGMMEISGLHAHDIIIAISVIALGGVLMAGRGIDRLRPVPVMAGFALAGLVHGHAYGEAVLGAEATPVIAYMIGLGAVQFALALTAAGLTLNAITGRSWGALAPRLAGGVIAGVGLAHLAGIATATIFPAL